MVGSNACSSEPKLELGAAAPSPSDIPNSVSVTGTSVTLGHASDLLRKQTDVKSFRIAKSPIMVGQFRKCVEVGACEKPDKPAQTPNNWTNTYNESTDYDELPIAGVTLEQANAYCTWVGGRLPSFAQWQLATRGENVQKFSWGNDTPTCGKYFLTPWTMRAQAVPVAKRAAGVRSLAGSQMSGGCCEKSCQPLQAKVGQYSEGASPSGVEDVLLTPQGEFIGIDKNNAGAFSCSTGTGCMVVTRSPGVPSSSALVPVPKGQIAGVGFRCTWEG
jgi:formylglycine-generating enzyme required for sulfatase activity